MPYAKIEPSGCGEFHGNVKVRLSFFLNPDDAKYEHTYGQVPIIPPEGYLGKVDKEGNPQNQADYDAWCESLPKKWQLVPFHNHFVYVDPDITEVELESLMAFHLPNFYEAWKLDRVPGGMRRGWDVKHRVRPLRYGEVDEPEIFTLRKAQCRQRSEALKQLNIAISSKGEGEIFPATEIDVGADATNRGSFQGYGKTILGLDNPANDTGSIDTADVWAETEMEGVIAGTFYFIGVTTYRCRDSEALGTATVPSNQTPQSFTGLDIEVETDDFAGCYFTVGRIEKDYEGFAGFYYVVGEYITPDDQKAYTLAAGDAISLYLTGETVAPPVVVTPPTLALSDAQYIPIIKWGIIPPVLALSDTQYAPVIIIGINVIPSTLVLTQTFYIPGITITADKVVTPTTLVLTLTEYAPTISFTENWVLTPTTLALTLTKYAPDVILKVIVSGALGYTIEVRDSAGNLLAILENAFGISLVEQLNRPPMLDFRLPADDDKAAFIDPDNEIWLRDYETGTLINRFLLSRRRDKRQ